MYSRTCSAPGRVVAVRCDSNNVTGGLGRAVCSTLFWAYPKMSTILEKIASIEAEVIAVPDYADNTISWHCHLPWSRLPDGPHPEEQSHFRTSGSVEGKTSQAQTRTDHPERRRRGWRARFRSRQDRWRSYRLRRYALPIIPISRISL